MQVNKVNTTIPKNINKINKTNINNKRDVSFKGLGPVDSLSLGVANLIENGGLAVSFTLQDMLGTNLPRPIMGLRRNARENHGEKNFNFALKEMVREFLTGPSMFIIPGVSLFATKRLFGQTMGIPAKFTKAFGDIHAAKPLNGAGRALSKEEFYKNVCSEMIKNAKSEAKPSEETMQQAKTFAHKLISGFSKTAGTTKREQKRIGEAVLSKLNEDFVHITKSHAKDVVHTDFTQAVISPTTAAPFKKAVTNMMAYANDIVTGASKNGTANIREYIKKSVNSKVIGRTALNVAMYTAVLSFLHLIPKLYNKAEGKDNSGLKGLMTEETFRDESLNKPQTDNKQEKSKVSFGSAEKIVNAITHSKLAQTFEYDGPNVSFPLLLGIMGGGILLPRTLQAKDKYDREEILRRDLVTCAVMCYGEKALRKGFSKYSENKSGFVVAAKPQNFKDKSTLEKLFNYVRPIKGVQILPTDRVRSVYTDIGSYKNGIGGFCEFISEQGGNLAKVFGFQERSAQIVDGLLKESGQSLAKADNKTITSVLTKAKDSEAVQELIGLFHKQKIETIKNPNLLQKLFNVTTKKIDNPWVKNARTMNARFTAFSVLLLVPLFLGFGLPFINERLTKKRINEENLSKAINTPNDISSPDNNIFKKNYKENAVFADMNKFLK